MIKSIEIVWNERILKKLHLSKSFVSTKIFFKISNRFTSILLFFVYSIKKGEKVVKFGKYSLIKSISLRVNSHNLLSNSGVYFLNIFKLNNNLLLNF